MKYKLLLILIICLLSFSLEAQKKHGTLEYTFEETKQDARASGDSFLHRGDTLYLFFDKTDSLQIKRKKNIEWWLRFRTEKEKTQDTLDVDLFDLEGPVSFLAQQWNLLSKNELSADKVKKLILTTRKELIAFYERENKRNEDKKIKDKTFKRYVWAWGYWDLNWYFDKLFVIEPKDDGTYIEYEIGY